MEVMAHKKSKKANLESKRIVFLEIGFVIVLAMVLYAFEYKSYDKVDYNKGVRMVDNTPQDFIPIIVQKEKPLPPKPIPAVTKINVVDDKVDKVEDIYIDDTFDENSPMEEYIYFEKPDDVEEQKIYVHVQNMPEFQGGLAAMYSFIGKNIIYPRMAKEIGIEGRVFLTFVVERDGSVTDVQTLRGIGGGCDEEAVRVIKAMPKWNPGKQREKPVRVQFQMPIKFTLQ